MSHKEADRNQRIVDAIQLGESISSVAKSFDLTKGRVSQIYEATTGLKISRTRKSSKKS